MESGDLVEAMEKPAQGEGVARPINASRQNYFEPVRSRDRLNVPAPKIVTTQIVTRKSRSYPLLGDFHGSDQARFCDRIAGAQLF